MVKILLLLAFWGGAVVAQTASEVTDAQKKAINERLKRLDEGLMTEDYSLLPGCVTPASLAAYMTEVKTLLNRAFLAHGEELTKRVWGIRGDFEELMAERDAEQFFKDLRVDRQVVEKEFPERWGGGRPAEIIADLIPGEVISFAPNGEGKLFAVVETGSLREGVDYLVYPMEWVDGKWLFDLGPNVVRRARARNFPAAPPGWSPEPGMGLVPLD